MIRILPIVGLLLLIPLIAMQLTNEVNWSFFDFIIMGGMLTITGLLIGIILKKVNNSKNRLILIVTIVMIFFLIWAELAVGLFGTTFTGDWISTSILIDQCGAYYTHSTPVFHGWVGFFTLSFFDWVWESWYFIYKIHNISISKQYLQISVMSVIFSLFYIIIW